MYKELQPSKMDSLFCTVSQKRQQCEVTSTYQVCCVHSEVSRPPWNMTNQWLFWLAGDNLDTDNTAGCGFCPKAPAGHRSDPSLPEISRTCLTQCRHAAVTDMCLNVDSTRGLESGVGMSLKPLCALSSLCFKAAHSAVLSAISRGPIFRVPAHFFGFFSLPNLYTLPGRT